MKGPWEKRVCAECGKDFNIYYRGQKLYMYCRKCLRERFINELRENTDLRKEFETKLGSKLDLDKITVAYHGFGDYLVGDGVTRPGIMSAGVLWHDQRLREEEVKRFVSLFEDRELAKPSQESSEFPDIAEDMF